MFWNCFKQQAPERTVTTQETLEYLFSCTTFFDKYRETRNCLVSQQPALPERAHVAHSPYILSTADYAES